MLVLHKIMDEYDNYVELNYNGENVNLEITDGKGFSICIELDESGLLSLIEILKSMKKLNFKSK